MSTTNGIAVFGPRATITGWAAISLSPRSRRSAQHRVRRRPDYPATLGLDHLFEDICAFGVGRNTVQEYGSSGRNAFRRVWVRFEGWTDANDVSAGGTLFSGGPPMQFGCTGGQNGEEGREGGRAENGGSVNWAFMRPMLSSRQLAKFTRRH